MMQNMKKNHYVEMWETRVNECKGKIAYLEEALSSELENWEYNEYSKQLANAKAELPGLEHQLAYVISLNN
jgi:predicted  nucleic acid-binding Zn-ribbon protein